MKPCRLTHKQVLEMLSRYPDTPSAEIAAQYGVSTSTVYQTAKRYRIRKSEAFMKSPAGGRIQQGQRRSIATEFKKGQKTTLGQKLTFRSEATKIKGESTRWRKGNLPHNTKEDGAITVRCLYSDGQRKQYKYIRLSVARWEFLHRHLWMTHHGDIPKGSNVIFRDGDTMNCVIENLECITDKELAYRNRHTQYPAEIRQLIEARNKLNREIHEQRSNIS